MTVVETQNGTTRCPDHIAIIGGGRWARQLADSLCRLVAPSVGVSVHSRHDIDSLAAWADAHGWTRRLQLSSAWPERLSAEAGAVIVANAARDHEAAVAWALDAGLPVMVEKPIALTGIAARRLAELARDRDVLLAAAHVFLFARYLENFSKLIVDGEAVDLLHIDWADPAMEERYGERKQYDPSLPVFSDWLPHVVSIAGACLPQLPYACRKLEVRRGGAALELELTAGSVPCVVRLERNAERRRRICRVSVAGEMFQLDFSTEPGTIRRGSAVVPGDSHWHSSMRPVSRMLVAFLNCAAGGDQDARLDVGPGLQACGIIDQVSDMYRSALLPWLAARLAARATGDEDVLYALAELLQADGPVETSELERQIKVVSSRFTGEDAARWLRELTHTRNPARLLAAAVA